MKTFGEKAFGFLKNLEPNFICPKEISCLLPFHEQEAIRINDLFYKKFYNDDRQRKMILGINPGRFGAGVTGVSFTDPIKLETILGIRNDFVKRTELSSDFIYLIIEKFGGPEIFFKQFFMTAICPIGFTKNGINLNYYDDKILLENLNEFIVEAIQKQIDLGIDRSICYCLGEGKNYKVLLKLNDQHQFFKKIVPLAHPRYIMQYKRKLTEQYVKLYMDELTRI